MLINLVLVYIHQCWFRLFQLLLLLLLLLLFVFFAASVGKRRRILVFLLHLSHEGVNEVLSWRILRVLEETFQAGLFIAQFVIYLMLHVFQMTATCFIHLNILVEFVSLLISVMNLLELRGPSHIALHCYRA